ncbi:MAG: hypothetical protein NW216_01835 [Hyphomicrobium sp.]|nr:hypothetical protein [Hyphomicrobium sp.]
MNTGLTSLDKLPEIGAAYPFHGMEMAFTVGLALFFIAFIMQQIYMEATHHKEIIGSFTASPAE